MPNVFRPPGTCPVCGEDVPTGARACPDCGADARSGWDEDSAIYDDLDLPDAADEGEKKPRPAPRFVLDRGWIALGVLLLAALILTLIYR